MLAPLPLGILAVLVAGVAGLRAPSWIAANEGAMYGTYLLLLAGVVWACREARVSFRSLVGAPPRDAESWSHVSLAVATFSIMIASAPIMMSLIAWVAPDLLREFAGRGDVMTRNTILVAVVVAPIVEELVFRGVVLRSLAARWGTNAGIVASALVFGILHVGAFGAVAFGIVMALVYLRTRTLLVPIACHVLHNGLVVLAGTVGPSGATLDVDAARADLWLGLLGLAGALAIFVAVVRRLRPEGGVWEMPELRGRG
jgi:membrane protease YdiL (CAAX protease family)